MYVKLLMHVLMLKMRHSMAEICDVIKQLFAGDITLCLFTR